MDNENALDPVAVAAEPGSFFINVAPVGSAQEDPKDPKVDEADRRLSDLDIFLIRLHIQSRLMGNSSTSSPRSWLTEEQNQEVAEGCQAFWKHMDGHYAQMSLTPLEERPAAFDLINDTYPQFMTEMKNKGVKRLHGVDLLDGTQPQTFDPLPPAPIPNNRDVARCMGRDMERAWDTFAMLEDMVRRSNTTKLRLGEAAEKSLASAAKLMGEPTAQTGRPIHAAALDLLRRVTGLGSFEQVNGEISQADVDRRRMFMSDRFGLDGITISASACHSPRQQVRWLESAEKNLAAACTQLGIRESQFGMNTRTSFELDPPEVGAMMGAHGCFQQFLIDNSKIRLTTSTFDPVGTLVHEYTHQLDNVLGLKAAQAAPDLIKAEPPVFFSNLTPEQQAVLPMAREGFGLICNQTTTSTVFDKLKGVLMKIDPEGGEKSPEDLRHSHNATLITRAVEQFELEHLGAENLLKMGAQDHAEYQRSIRSEGVDSIVGIAKAWTTEDFLGLFNRMGGTDEEKPYMKIARKFLGQDEPRRRRKAIEKIDPLMVGLNANLNGISQSATLKVPSRPGSMMEASVREDRRAMDFGGKTYYSQPWEVLARIVSRPQTMDMMAGAVHIPWSFEPMSKAQLKDLSTGFSKLLEAAGVATKHGPKLAVFMEAQTFSVAKHLVHSTSAANKIASRVSRMFKPSEDGFFGSSKPRTASPPP